MNNHFYHFSGIPLSNRVVQEIFLSSISQFLDIKLKRVVTEGLISLIK